MQCFVVKFADRGDALGSDLAVLFFPFDPDKITAQHLGNRTCGARAEERIKDHIPGIGRTNQHAVQQAFRLLRRMRLVTVVIFQSLMPVADRENPIAAHLDAFIQRLQGFIVEGVFARLILARPDHRLMSIGKAFAAKVRHRVGLAPDHIVENPEALVLKGGPNAENVVVAADHPDRTIRLKQTARRLQPLAGEFVVCGKAIELVPMVINCIDLGVVRAVQIAAQLKVVGRVCEDQIDAALRKRIHHLDAIAVKDRVQGKRLRSLGLYCHCSASLPGAFFALVG